MSEVCSTCGLPKELCVCEDIAKEAQNIVISTAKKKFGKLMTIIEGIDSKQIDVKDVAKKLKSEFACGGTLKDGVIELQGDHKQKAKQALVKLGFSADTVEVKDSIKLFRGKRR